MEEEVSAKLEEYHMPHASRGVAFCSIEGDHHVGVSNFYGNNLIG
jgi:hypothetical protein